METNDLILDRIQRLLCLALESQPAAELIPGTAKIWMEHLGRIDPERLLIAFHAVEKHLKRWPTIAHIRECLPSYSMESRLAPEKRIERQRTPEEEAVNKERVRKVIEECQRRLGEKVDDPETAAGGAL